MRKWILILTCLLIVISSKSDEYVNPVKQIFYSQNGLFKLVIKPTEVPKGFDKEFKRREKKPEKYKNIPFVDSIRHCSAILYEKNGTWEMQYERIWEKKLENSNSPEFAFISNDGKYVATVNDWYYKVNSKNTFVVYDQNGFKLKNYTLYDFIPFSKQELSITIISTEWFVGIENYSEEPYIIKILTHDKNFNIEMIYYNFEKLEFNK